VNRDVDHLGGLPRGNDRAAELAAEREDDRLLCALVDDLLQQTHEVLGARLRAGGQRSACCETPVELVRLDVYAVVVLLSIPDEHQWDETDAVLLQQRGGDITGAIGNECNVAGVGHVRPR